MLFYSIFMILTFASCLFIAHQQRLFCHCVLLPFFSICFLLSFICLFESRGGRHLTDTYSTLSIPLFNSQLFPLLYTLNSPFGLPSTILITNFLSKHYINSLYFAQSHIYFIVFHLLLQTYSTLRSCYDIGRYCREKLELSHLFA